MFRIGEFAQVAQVSNRLLRYYDQLGLLRPVRIDPETGYRYYSARQLPRLNRILALKSLGLSLDQIAKLVDDDISSDEIRGMLTLRKAESEQLLREEQARLREIESRIQQIDGGGSLDGFDVVVKAVEAQSFLAMRAAYDDLGQAVTSLRCVVDAVRTILKPGAWHRLVVVSYADFAERELDLQIGVTLNTRVNKRVDVPGHAALSLVDLPGAESMATLVRSGPAYASHFAFGALGAWMEANGYAIDGPCREIFLELPFTDPAKEDTVVEIQFPVRKAA